MPGWCVVPYCGRKAGGHLFPKNPQRRKKWKIAVRRHENWEPSSYSTVCRMHFKEDDYVNNGIALPRKLKQDAVPSVFRWTMFQNTEEYEKQAKERSERARRRPVAKYCRDVFVDYIEQEYTALNECEVSTEDVYLGSSPVLTTSMKTSSVAAQTDPVPNTSLSVGKLQDDDKSVVSRANDKKTHKPPGSSQEGPDYMDMPQTGVQKVAPQQTSFAMRQGTAILQLNPATKKFIPVTVNLPQLPPVQGSGQGCRQPVLQSSGPASSERLGPQPCLSACGPYPVMLIGPREKRLLAQMYPVKARSPEEGECQSSLQVTQASQECAAVPVKVKLEEAEDSAASCQEEREVHQTPQEFAVSVKVKVEPLEEDGDTRCFEKREIDQTPQDFAVLPVEVKVEKDMGYSDTLMQVKTEPLDT